MMDFEKELTAMGERMFSEQLLERVLAACRGGSDPARPAGGGGAYPGGMAYAGRFFSREQQEELAEIEALERGLCAALLEHGFGLGAAAAFSQAAQPPQLAASAARQAAEDLLRRPLAGIFPALQPRFHASVRRLRDLAAEAGKEALPHLESVLFYWVERELGVLRHGYCLGYRWGLGRIASADPGLRAGLSAALDETERALSLRPRQEEG